VLSDVVVVDTGVPVHAAAPRIATQTS